MANSKVEFALASAVGDRVLPARAKEAEEMWELVSSWGERAAIPKQFAKLSELKVAEYKGSVVAQWAKYDHFAWRQIGEPSSHGPSGVVLRRSLRIHSSRLWWPFRSGWPRERPRVPLSRFGITLIGLRGWWVCV